MKIRITESQLKLIKEDLSNTIPITEFIKNLINRYISEYDDCHSAYDINNGLCVSFMEDLQNEFGGDETSGEMFHNYDYDEAAENWGEEDLLLDVAGGAWSKKMLRYHGLPPVKDITQVTDLPSHVWLQYNGKHYDAESPEGVDSPWDLSIHKIYFNSLNK